MPIAPAVLRPDGTASVPGAPPGGGAWSLQGGAVSHHGAQSDNTDATFSRYGAGWHSDTLVLNMTTFAKPTGAQVRQARIRVRAKLAALVGVPAVYPALRINGSLYSSSSFGVPQGFGTAWNTFEVIVSSHDFSQAEIDSFQVGILFVENNGGAATVDFAETYLDIYYNERPATPAITAPVDEDGGTAGIQVTSTNKPTFTATYSDPEGDTLERFRLKIFSGTGVVADPTNETTRLVYDSGEVFSSNPSHTITQVLANAGYIAYWANADQGSNGRYSAWSAGYAFTMATTPTPTPFMDALQVAGGVAVDTHVISSSPATSSIDLQYSDDGGVTFKDLRGGANLSVAPIIDDFSEADTTNLSAKATDTAGFSWTVQAGTLRVMGAAAALTAANANASATVDPLIADVAVQATVPVLPGGADTAGVVARATDGNNHLRLVVGGATDNNVRLIRRQAGVNTNLQTWAGRAAGDTLRLVCVGNQVSAYRNGVLLGTITEAFNQTATKHGIFIGEAAATVSRVDNFLAGKAFRIIDLEPRVGKQRQYRATAFRLLNGLEISSATVIKNFTYLADGWRLNDLVGQTSLLLNVESFSRSPQEPKGIFDLLGRDDPVPITEGRKGWEITVSIRLDGLTAHEEFEAMLESGRTLYLIDGAHPRSWYVSALEGGDWEQVRAPDVTGTYKVRMLTRVAQKFRTVARPL